MFSIRGHLWLFVEYYAPAHPSNRKRAEWEHAVLPHWPHVQEYEDINERYDCVQASAVEGVHFMAPDINRPGYHYVVRASSTRLWHEFYEDFDDGSGRGAGELDHLEPDAFLGMTSNREAGDAADDRAQLNRSRGPTDDEAAATRFLHRHSAGFTGYDDEDDG
jgi:hypothetical protein